MEKFTKEGVGITAIGALLLAGIASGVINDINQNNHTRDKMPQIESALIKDGFKLGSDGQLADIESWRIFLPSIIVSPGCEVSRLEATYATNQSGTIRDLTSYIFTSISGETTLTFTNQKDLEQKLGSYPCKTFMGNDTARVN